MGKLYDRAALDRLMLEHLPAALALATKLTGSVHDAEDVVQTALLKAARSIDSFHGGASLRTWFTAIFINCFRDWLRTKRAQRERGELSDGVIDPRSRPFEDAYAAELGDRVAQAVSGLPLRQREVLVLHFYEQLSTSQIAAVLGISEANVRKNLQLARDRLRVELAADVNDEVRRE
jgi:RNA polymerase sigma-70 factor (ECF subfamily)